MLSLAFLTRHYQKLTNAELLYKELLEKGSLKRGGKKTGTMKPNVSKKKNGAGKTEQLQSELLLDQAISVKMIFFLKG